MEGGGYAIPAGNTIVFEVHADVASYSSSADIQLKFATSDSYIGAEELDDGASLSGIGTNGTCTAGTCMILVHTVDSTVWSLVSQGNLYVTSSSVPTPIRQLLGGELGESILNLKFRASDEDVDVTDIRLTSYDLSDSIDVLELYKKDETTPFALATRNCPSNALATNPITGVATKTFCADMENEQLIALEGEEVSVFVRPRMKSDVNGGASDESIQLFVNKEETVDDNSVGAILARGRESSNDLVSNNEDDVEDGEIFIGVNAPAPNQYIIGRKHTSVLSKIVSITNANPDSNGSSISSGVVPFGQFAFMAADNKNSWSGFNDVVLSDILFNVNSTNVELAYDSFRIYNKADATTKKTCTVYKSGDETPLTTNTPGALVVDCRDLTSGSGGLVNTAIDPNKKATFVLEAEVVRSSVRPEANSTLQAQIQQFNNSENTTYGHSAYDTRSHIRWQDMDSDIDGTFTWMEHPSSAVSSTSYRN